MARIYLHHHSASGEEFQILRVKWMVSEEGNKREGKKEENKKK
jgi:hypothetical protein